MFGTSALRLFAAAVLVVGTARAANLCFLPDGDSSLDTPCDTSAAVSMCCGTAGHCLSNGLCRDSITNATSGTSYARGTCTDPTWQSPICPQICQLNQDTPNNFSAFDFRANGVQVWECNAKGYSAKNAEYCCESESEKTRCCSTKTALFTLLAATSGNALPVQTVSSGTSSNTSSSTTLSSTLLMTSILVATAIWTNTPTSQPAAAINAGNNEEKRPGLATSTAVAIGLGASLSSAFLVTCAILVVLKRRGDGFGRGRPMSQITYGSAPGSGSETENILAEGNKKQNPQQEKEPNKEQNQKQDEQQSQRQQVQDRAQNQEQHQEEQPEQKQDLGKPQQQHEEDRYWHSGNGNGKKRMLRVSTAEFSPLRSEGKCAAVDKAEDKWLSEMATSPAASELDSSATPGGWGGNPASGSSSAMRSRALRASAMQSKIFELQ